MSNNNTGGAAFAQCSYNMKGGYDITGGMSLRDYFAAKAMQALLAKADSYMGWDTIPADAYEMADAMLKARAA